MSPFSQAYMVGCSFDTFSKSWLDRSYIVWLILIAWLLPMAVIGKATWVLVSLGILKTASSWFKHAWTKPAFHKLDVSCVLNVNIPRESPIVRPMKRNQRSQGKLFVHVYIDLTKQDTGLTACECIWFFLNFVTPFFTYGFFLNWRWSVFHRKLLKGLRCPLFFRSSRS